MTPTPEQQEQLQAAFEEAMSILGRLSGVLGFACVVVTQDGPQTLYAGDTQVIASGLDLLNVRFDQDGILEEIDELISEEPPADPNSLIRH